MLSKFEMTPIQPGAADFNASGIYIVILLILLSLRRRLSRGYICL